MDNQVLSPMHSNSRVRCPSHLMYANDILIFCKASRKNMMSLMALFTSYSAISGQSANWEKSQIFFGKHVSSSRALMLKQMAGMQSGSLPLNIWVFHCSKGLRNAVGYNLLLIPLWPSLIIGRDLPFRWRVIYL